MNKLLFTRYREGQDFSTVYAKKSDLWSSLLLTCERYYGPRRASLVDYAFLAQMLNLILPPRIAIFCGFPSLRGLHACRPLYNSFARSCTYSL